MRLVSDILTFQPQGKGTDLAVGLDFLSRLARRKTVTFLVSDFLTQGFESSLRLVGRKHDLVPVAIVDPLERELPRLGLVEMEDPETGERFVVDTSNALVRGRFARAMQAQRDELRKLFKKLELDHVELNTGDDHGMVLVRFFRARSRRMAA